MNSSATDCSTFDLISLVTDAHCHPTDVPFPEETVQNVGLGGLASMATRTTDQDLVAQFSLDHGLRDEDEDDRAIKRTRRPGPETIACFGRSVGITARWMRLA
jgi:hypothetical protein